MALPSSSAQKQHTSPQPPAAAGHPRLGQTSQEAEAAGDSGRRAVSSTRLSCALSTQVARDGPKDATAQMIGLNPCSCHFNLNFAELGCLPPSSPRLDRGGDRGTQKALPRHCSVGAGGGKRAPSGSLVTTALYKYLRIKSTIKGMRLGTSGRSVYARTSSVDQGARGGGFPGSSSWEMEIPSAFGGRLSPGRLPRGDG